MSATSVEVCRSADGRLDGITVQLNDAAILDALADAAHRAGEDLDAYIVSLLSPTPRSSDEVIADLVRRGHSDGYVGAHVGLSRETIRRWRDDRHIPANRHGVSVDRAARRANANSAHGGASSRRTVA